MLQIPFWRAQRSLCIALQLVIFQSFNVLSVLGVGGLCSKAVAVQRESKKVHVLRRLPAACSNWDKSWAWLTKVDCGTKYRLDYVTVPPREAVTYRIEYACCAGDTKCESDKGLVTSDEKFLAIILGSTAAALLILVLIITISLCHKRRQLRCPVMCDSGSHIYETAEDIDEAAELQGNRGTCVDETNNKVCESEYEEIRDCKRELGKDSDGLPRYADLFSEKIKRAQELGVDPPCAGDAFNRATAPPLTSEDPDFVSQHCDVQEVLSGTAKILVTETDTLQCTVEDSDRIYYNIAPEKDSVDMQESGPCEEGASVPTGPETVCASSDCKSNTDCSNYDQLIEPDTLSDVDCHEYQKLVDLSEAASQNANANDKCIVEPSQTQVTMNGHLEAQSC
ncbi:uncharacterized protein LOC124137985 isoform X1 [Haliotis rufescens]|uniref:uncharacterized protein LOC124137985 isoform X1 n=1 Tax=Haliotis rufescens TaxID=6454 RepID=UPI001EAFEBFD|nr:uncharacterized protein LOC124137985 isoform X1 [Haliotis rufescens]XP_046360432.1 uncharacterized protein LOC124137985 isoform X1 [Haliotis rufescens]XP_046360433.1 uncharacterized protein LOC124137985 isoform X1 [Haliotis rufescens]XP_046360435.1 uncharacterized protein LOC124137985 isoform X1 [Haliotis rufescens]